MVEDDLSSGDLLRKILEKFDYNIVGLVDSGEEAIVKARELKPDLILMDITLSGKIDGIEAAEIIGKELNIPFIYITGWSEDSVFNRAKKTMPLGFILKPFNSHIIKTSIDLALYKFTAEEKLRESEKRNSEILSYIPDIMFKLNKDGSFIDKKDREMAKNIWPSKVSDKAMQFIVDALQSNELKLFDYFLKKSEELKYYEARIMSASEDAVLVIVRDMTEKKNAELKLREHMETLESEVEDRTKTLTMINDNLKVFSHVVSQSPNMVIIVNSEGIVQYANGKFLEMSGYSLGEIVGLDIKRAPNPIISEVETWEEIVSRKVWTGELYNISKSGTINYQKAKVTTLRDDQDNILSYLIIGEDITEKKRQEKEIEKVNTALEKSQVNKIDLEMDWKEWKEKMLSRTISRTDKSLFKNINISFTQGAGLGAMISLIEVLATSKEKADDRYLVNGKLFDLVMKNVDTAKTALKTFANIDWVISHDFALETFTFYDLYNFIRVVIKKSEEFCGIKNQKIIINDFDQNNKSYRVNINKEFLYKALYEMLLNSMKFSRNNSYIIILISIVNRKVNISVTNEPEKGENDVLGIPVEYEKLIFEPFYRLSRNVYEQYKSLDFGIGLTLIEKVVGKHKGEVFIGNIIDHSDLKKEPVTKVNVTITLPVIS